MDLENLFFATNVKIYYLLIIWLGCSMALQAQPTEMHDGVLDLRHATLDDATIIPLRGKWHFFHSEFYPAQTMQSLDNKQFIHIPSEWNETQWRGKQLGAYGFATYQARILLPKNLASLAIHFSTQGTAYRVFANDRLIKEVGKVSKDAATAQARYENYLHIFDQVPDTLTLTFHISNYHYNKGGMWHEPLLGKREAVIQWHERLVAGEFIMLGAVLFMALYHFALFFFRPGYRAPLYFALLCVCTIVREGSLGDLLWVKVFPAIPWELLIKLEYLSLFVGFVMAYKFIQCLFAQEFHSIAVQILNLLFGFFIGFTILFPASVSSQIIVPFQFVFLGFVGYASWVLFQTIRHKRNGAIIFTIGVWFLFIAGINDVLYYNYLISTGATMTLGLFFYFFSQVLILAKRSSEAFSQNEKLSTELLLINNNLEQKIQERTQQLNENIEELNQSNQHLIQALEAVNQHKERLEDLNREKDGLVGVVAHDLRAPFNRQKGLLELLHLTGELNEEQKSFVALMKKTCEQGINFIRDLLVINNAESEIELPELVAVQIADFVQEIINDFGAIAQNKQIKIHFQMISNVEIKPTVPEYLQRILENLISNALKFSYPQKNILIQLNQLPNDWEITIEDQGQGIAESEMPQLFKKFKKLSARPTAGEDSSGLGLAIVKSLVEKLNGSISVKSTLGVGTTFSLRFPN
ncbi:MAG: sensor histidine kinase [Microscillaceae bacterium]|jgi:signal transduction histidine kinase|nr:sensor histidine kinase [Microscillaceae bacterium]